MGAGHVLAAAGPRSDGACDPERAASARMARVSHSLAGVSFFGSKDHVGVEATPSVTHRV